VHADGRQMLVTGGLGSGLNLRFLMPPEILFVRLEAGGARSDSGRKAVRGKILKKTL